MFPQSLEFQLNEKELSAAQNKKIGIARALWHNEITEGILNAILKNFAAHSIKCTFIQVNCGGSLELPYLINKLIKEENPHGIIAIGCVIKGETSHDFYISMSIFPKIVDLSITHDIPIATAIITANNRLQAIRRISISAQNAFRSLLVAFTNEKSTINL